MIGDGIGDSEFSRCLEERFEILDLLGKGGMGTVYRARDRESDREVALKVALRAPGSTHRNERFRREGELTARLNHSGIVRVHTSGELAGRPYLTYELVEGSQDLLEAGRPRGARDRVELVRDAARALGYAHAQGIVHRDVKPQNILVDSAGRVRVADFGLAWAQDQERITKTGAAIGTAHYMSPEQVAGGRDVGPPADVWALGVVLYQLLSDRLPFEGGAFMEVVAKICQGSPAPLRAGDAELRAICARAMERDPARRYATGEGLAADLDRYLAGEPVAASAEREPLFARGWSWVKRRRWWLVPLLGSFAMLGLALTIPTRPGPSSPASEAAAPQDSPAARPSPTLSKRRSSDGSPGSENAAALLFVTQARRRCDLGDLVSAEALLRRAIREGSVVARVELARLVISGLVVADGAAAARALLRDAARDGNAEAKELLAARPDPLERAEQLGERASRGERSAMFALARLLRDRFRTWPGFVHWAMRAAKGPRTSQLAREARLDLMKHYQARYAGGERTPTVRKELVRWSRRAAEADATLGMKTYAGLLRRGLVVVPDTQAAMRWLVKAADMGDGEAMVILGEMQMVGREVPRDEHSATQWLRKAANSEDATGFYRLGLIYLHGRATMRVNLPLAANYFHKAAQRGEPRGMLEYGKLIHAGHVPRMRRSQGRFWIQKAALLGYAPAKKLAASLGEGQ